MRAELRIRLRHDLVGATEAVEVVDVQGAQIHLQCLEHIRQLDVLLLHLDAIDVHVELRDVDLVAAELTCQRRVLVRLLQCVVDSRVQRALAQVGTILHLELEPAEGAESLHRRRREHHHERVLDGRKLLVERRGNRLRRKVLRVPLVEGVQREEVDGSVGTRRVVVDGHAAELHGARDSGRFEPDLGQLLGDLIGALERGRRRQLSDGDDVLLVLVGNEPSGDCVEAEVGQRDETRVNGQRDGASAHGVPDDSGVGIPGFLEASVEALEESPQHFVHEGGEPVRLRSMGLEQHGSEGGRERQRVEG